MSGPFRTVAIDLTNFLNDEREGLAGLFGLLALAAHHDHRDDHGKHAHAAEEDNVLRAMNLAEQGLQAAVESEPERYIQGAEDHEADAVKEHKAFQRQAHGTDEDRAPVAHPRDETKRQDGLAHVGAHLFLVSRDESFAVAEAFLNEFASGAAQEIIDDIDGDQRQDRNKAGQERVHNAFGGEIADGNKRHFLGNERQLIERKEPDDDAEITDIGYVLLDVGVTGKKK